MQRSRVTHIKLGRSRKFFFNIFLLQIRGKWSQKRYLQKKSTNKKMWLGLKWFARNVFRKFTISIDVKRNIQEICLATSCALLGWSVFSRFFFADWQYGTRFFWSWSCWVTIWIFLDCSPWPASYFVQMVKVLGLQNVWSLRFLLKCESLLQQGAKGQRLVSGLTRLLLFFSRIWQI